MATSSADSIFGLGTTRITIGVGSTLAFLLTHVAGQNSTVLKYFSGGTLEVIGVADGVTLTAAQLGAANQTGYIMGTTEVLSIDGPVRCYLSATAATTVVMALLGKSQGI